MNKFRLLATLLVVALCTTTIFTSCRNGDDDDNGNGAFEIRATNVIAVDGSNIGRAATVRAVIWLRNDRTAIVGETPVQNNGFTLRLTNDVPEAAFESLSDDDWLDGFTVSDRNARWAFLDEGILAFNSGGNEIGEFWFGSPDEDADEGFYVFWIYADRNVTIRGTVREEDNWGIWESRFDMNLRRGWNAVYEHWTWNEATRTDIFRLTSQRPSGATLRWYFWESDSRASRATTRAAENRRSVFRR